MISVKYFGSRKGGILRGKGTCGMCQSFPVISANVPCTYYVHRDIQTNVQESLVVSQAIRQMSKDHKHLNPGNRHPEDMEVRART